MRVYLIIAIPLTALAIIYAAAAYNEYQTVKSRYNRDEVEVAQAAKHSLKALIAVPLAMIWPVSLPIVLIACFIRALARSLRDSK